MAANSVLPLRLLRVAFAVALSLSSASLHAQTRTTPPPALISDSATLFIRQWPELASAVIVGYTPVYKPRSGDILFYEAKMSSSRTGAPQGSLVLDLMGKVVQFTTSGPSYAERLSQKTSSAFKMVRFGPRYMAAEDSRGVKVAEVGELPALPVSRTSNTLLQRPSFVYNSLSANPGTRPAIDPSQLRKYTSTAEMYSDYVLNYDAYFANRVKTPAAPDFFKGVLSLMNADPKDPNGGAGGGGSAGGGSGVDHADAIGHNQSIRIPQMLPSDPLNQLGFYSGCGGDAWLNMYLWHDQNWLHGLLTPPYSKTYLEGDNTPTTTWEAMHLNDLAKTLGTFENPVNGLGATFASDMHRGHDIYAPKQLGYNVDVVEVDSWFTNEPADLAYNAIVNYGKPAIIGYWEDVHYDVAYRWRLNNNKSYFYTDFGSWVEASDIFYAAFPMDFRSVGNNFGENAGFETGLTGWNWKLQNAGSISVVTQDVSAAQGLQFLRLQSAGAGVQKAWAKLEVPAAGVDGHTVSLKFRGTPGLVMQMKIRHVTGDYKLEPQGDVAASTTFNLYDETNWKELKLDIPAFGWFILEISYTGYVGSNSYHLDVDDGTVTTHWHDQQPANWQGLPCVKGKFGLDSGCQF